jgi:hypothetical protein
MEASEMREKVTQVVAYLSMAIQTIQLPEDFYATINLLMPVALPSI